MKTPNENNRQTAQRTKERTAESRMQLTQATVCGFLFKFLFVKPRARLVESNAQITSKSLGKGI